MILINLETKKEVEDVVVLADLRKADGGDGYYIKTSDTTVEYIHMDKYLIFDAAYIDAKTKVYTFMKWMDEDNIPYTYEPCPIEPLESHLCINGSKHTYVFHEGLLEGIVDDFEKYIAKKKDRYDRRR